MTSRASGRLGGFTRPRAANVAGKQEPPLKDIGPHICEGIKACQHCGRKIAGMVKKRGYSREFKPHGDTGKRYLLDKIPAGLWANVRAKAKNEGVSIRALLLTLLETWLKGRAA